MMTLENRKLLIDALDVIAKIAIAVFAGIWALYTYPESREKEFRKSYWDKQMSLLFEATETTAKVATMASNDPKRIEAVDTFWRLYWGPMTVIESKCEPCDPVDQAMINFGKCLKDPNADKPEETCTIKTLEQRSIALGKAARDSIGSSWDKKLELLIRDCPPGGGCPAATTR